MQACSGNTNDSEGFKKIVKSHVSSLKAAQRSRYLVADAALYVAETGCFIIATNDIDNKLTMDEFLSHINPKTATGVFIHKIRCGIQG